MNESLFILLFLNIILLFISFIYLVQNKLEKIMKEEQMKKSKEK
jgi:hypothetical protein